MASKRTSRLIKILSGATADTGENFDQLEGRLERSLYFWVQVIRSFINNRCLIRASALSYSSLLALIPMLAVAIGVTSSLLKKEGEQKIYHAIDKFVANVMPPANTTNAPALLLTPTNQTALTFQTNLPAATGTNVNAVAATAPPSSARMVSAQKTAAKSIHDFIQRTQSGTLGAVGMLALIFVAIQMLSNIEATFNDIWGIQRGRSWLWRIVLYWTTITLGPLALVGVLGLAGSSHLETVKNVFHHMPFLGGLLFDILPLVLLWLIFSLAYLLVPNTRVKFSAALVGGVVAGSAWHLNNYFGFLYVSRVVTNSKIYGSLGLVPVFMAGLYISWTILLFGAQVAYAFQNRKSYAQKKLVENVNQRGREFVALRLMTSLGQRFQRGLRPASAGVLSSDLGIPDPLVDSVLRTLAHQQLVTEVAGAETAFVPARPLDGINAYDILRAIRTGGGQDLPLHAEPALHEIYGEFARIEHAERNAATAITLQDLVRRLPSPDALPEAKPNDSASQFTDVDTVGEGENIPPPPSTMKPETASTKSPSAAASPKTEAEPSAPKADLHPGIPSSTNQNTGDRKVVTPEENREFPL